VPQTTRLSESHSHADHHLRRLVHLVRRADLDRYSTAQLESGWVASALSLGQPDTVRGRRFPGNTRQELAWHRAQELAHRRAHIDTVATVSAISTDTSGRAIERAPWAIYPFEPGVCARLVCDYLLIESTVSLRAAATALRREGAEVLEIPVPQPLATTEQPVLQVAIPFGERHPILGDHQTLKAAVITAHNLRQPVLETWTLDTWARTVVDLLRDPEFRLNEAAIPIVQFTPIPWR
jgi:hypothetical protein